MATPFMSRRDIDFMLYELLECEELTRCPRYAEHSKDTFDAILDIAADIATEHFYPHAAEGDKQEPTLVDGKVVTIPEVEKAIKVFADAGFFAAAHDREWGGVQLPTVVGKAVMAFFMAANIGTAGYPFMTMAASNLISTFGSDEQKARFLPPMLAGRYFGTMAMTEPQAGSSLSDIAAFAVPHPDGQYLVKGNKIFISCGEHELSENIIHLVLARIKGAPAGVKGLSLFIVPRYHVNADGSKGPANDVALSGLVHKLGWRGVTSTMLNFGENDRCVGYLLGEPHKGLNYMFHMMNEARIMVGMCATSFAYAGYLFSLDYARNRPQGRLPSSKDPHSKPVMIIEHADVRRMLLTQKAYVEGALSLVMYAALLFDRQKGAEVEEERHKSVLLLDILTPVVKAWPSVYCLEANSLAIQVLGGYGYTREYPVERYFRDNRLNQIHEGTTAIQGIDLLGRKLTMENGAAFAALSDEIDKTVKRAADEASLVQWSNELRTALRSVKGATDRLLSARERLGADLFLSNASAYLDMVGHLVVGWMWLRQAEVATRRGKTASGSNGDFYRGKLQACRYFFTWELPKVHHLADTLGNLDSTCHQMQDCWF
jgi:butyryl-CoA dehydrogenase